MEYGQMPSGGGTPGSTPNNNKAVASLVLGIVSVVCVFFGSAAFLGIILGVVGLILGINAKKEAPSSMATAGIILSIVAIAACAIVFIACVACIGFFSSAAEYSQFLN